LDSAGSEFTSEPVVSEDECSLPDVFCVGLVVPGGEINDKSLNEGCLTGLEAAYENGDVEVINYNGDGDNIAGEYESNIALFTDAGYDMVVTCGFQFIEATYSMALKNPNTYFVGVDQFLENDSSHPDLPLPNLVNVVYNEDQSGFLAGALAALMSESHLIGAVCATDIVPPVWRFCEGYRAGAAHIDASYGTSTDVTVIYHNDVGFDVTFSDPDFGRSTAAGMMDKGIDVIFGAGSQTGDGALLAGAERGIFVIGVDVDQYFTLPDAAPRMLTSALKPPSQPISDLIASARQGDFTNGLYFGPPGIAPYHDLDAEVSDDIKAIMDKLVFDITSGAITTGVPGAKP